MAQISLLYPENSSQKTCEMTPQGINDLSIDYIVENSTMVGVVPESLMSVFNNLYFELQLSKFNISESDYQKLHPNIIYNLVQSSDEEVKGED